MLTILVHSKGVTTEAAAVDPAWLTPTAEEIVWADIESPVETDRTFLTGVFGLHELAVEDALDEIHHPKIEAYDGLLYLILHGIAAGAGQIGFVTQDVDFFIGRNFLVTVHHGPSRSIESERTVCMRRQGFMEEGPVSLAHRIIDRLVDHYGPEEDRLEEWIDSLEQAVFDRPSTNPLKELLALKRDIAALRRVALPQRDAVGRLARREFPQISEGMAYRFRDVYDHLVRLTDGANFLQDRVTGLLEAYLSNQSNRLNQVMKVLTVISTIFMPLTVLTSMWGMNVTLPDLPGGPRADFWWVLLLMVSSSATMLWLFRRLRWL